MQNLIVMTRFKLIQRFKDPLYKNSMFLITSSLLNAVTGFTFWIIATRLYSVEDVGLASATISAVMLLHLFSLMGFDISLTHYLPMYKGNKSKLINSCMAIVFIISFILALIFIKVLDVWFPALMWIKKDSISLLSFIIFTISASLVSLQTLGIFVGLRKAKYSFIQTLLLSLVKLGTLTLLVDFGAYGIFMSYTLASILTFIVGLILTLRVINLYPSIPRIEKELTLFKILHYSLGNYIAKIFSMIPNYFLPILVLNVLGAKQSAYFYIAWIISSLLLAIPIWTSHTMLAEGSYNLKELKRISLKALRLILLFLIPASFGVAVLGKYILLFFGTDYVINSFDTLLILSLASVPYAFNIVYLTVKRIKEEIWIVIIAYGFLAIFTLLVSYVLLPIMGIIGVGISWLLGNGIIMIAIITRQFHN